MEDNKKNILRYAGLTTEWIVLLGGGAWAGHKLDQYLAWKYPVFVILFPLVALVISMWRLIKEFNKKK